MCMLETLYAFAQMHKWAYADRPSLKCARVSLLPMPTTQPACDQHNYLRVTQKALKAKGIDEVIVVCVNDGAVMQAWADDQGVEGCAVAFGVWHLSI